MLNKCTVISILALYVANCELDKVKLKGLLIRGHPFLQPMVARAVIKF